MADKFLRKQEQMIQGQITSNNYILRSPSPEINKSNVSGLNNKNYSSSTHLRPQNNNL